MTKAKRSVAAEIPQHMLENPISNAQKKAFAKVKRAETKAETPAAKKKAEKE